MGVTHHLKTNGGISSVTTNFWVENLYLSFSVSIISIHKFEWYRVTCKNRVEKRMAEKYL